MNLHFRPRPWPVSLGSALLSSSIGAISTVACAPDAFVIPVSSAEEASEATTDGDPSGGATTADTGPPGSTTGDACTPADAPDDWWDPAWRRRRLVRIDVSKLSAPLEGFPLLLRMRADELGATWSEREGADLRFRSSDHAVSLAYDLDDVVDGELALWLRLPVLDPMHGTTSVWMYYDNPEAAAGSASGYVWSGFISVHHLGADLRDSAGEHHGSSPWEPELCDDGCGPRIGLARSFDPERLHEVVLDGHQDYDLGSDPYADTFSFSVSLWTRSTSFAAFPWGPMVAKGKDTWRVQSTDFVDPALDDRLAFGFDCGLAACLGSTDALGNYNLIAPASGVDDGAWHHVAATFTAVDAPELPPPEYVPDVQARLYLDGVEVAASPVLPSFLVPEDDQPVRFGHDINTARRWRGGLDEVRISTGVRSAAEIAADHATVVDRALVAVEEEQAWCP